MTRSKIPLLLKMAYTLFVAFVVPYYWLTYSPWNFLNFCDVALLLMVPALWMESRFLVSLQAVAVLFPQCIWIADYLFLLAGGRLLGMTAYMFDPQMPAGARALSFFHAWMPALLLFLMFRLGYDRRALAWQCLLGPGLLLLCLAITPAPPAPAGHPRFAVNINFVWGLSAQKPQDWMQHGFYFICLLAVYLLLIWLPTGLVLAQLFGRAPVDALDRSIHASAHSTRSAAA